MKVIKYTLLLSLFMLSISSCKRLCFDENKFKLEAPGLVYLKVNQSLRIYMEEFILAKKIDAYIQAGIDERDSIRYYTLSGYDILVNQDSVLVEQADVCQWVIHRETMDSLTSKGAKWSITKYSILKSVEIGRLDIVNLEANNQWGIKAEGYSLVNLEGGSAFSDASIKVEIAPRTEEAMDYKEIKYSITTDVDKVNAIYAYPNLDKFVSSYIIVDPVIYIDNIHYCPFYAGEIDIKVDRGSAYDIDNIKAIILYHGETQLTFKGYTGMYENY